MPGDVQRSGCPWSRGSVMQLGCNSHATCNVMALAAGFLCGQNLTGGIKNCVASDAELARAGRGQLGPCIDNTAIAMKSTSLGSVASTNSSDSEGGRGPQVKCIWHVHDGVW
jgi:hypothetical protein